jgi:hypothetical protein
LRTAFSIGLIIAIVIAFLPEKTSAQIMRLPSAKATSNTDSQPAIRWPKPSQLLQEIEVFENQPLTKDWAARTKELVEFLCTKTEVTSQEAIDALMALNKQAQAINVLIGQVAQRQPAEFSTESAELVSDLQRFEYRLSRRIKIWAGVVDHVNSTAENTSKPIKKVSLAWLPSNLDDLLQRQIPNNVGWQDYLAWDDLIRTSRVTNMDKKAKVARQRAAQKFLARYHSASLSDAQRQLFQPFFSPEVLEGIHDAASEQINHSKMMLAIELLEAKDTGVAANYLNNAYQDLLWSEDEVAHELAALIDSHWRNSNFRVAINERLLNQMLPQVPATTEPVSERIQGARVSGQSLIETDQLRIALIPNPNEISLAVETGGKVTSETVAKRSGFTFENRGLADFKVLQKLAFSRTGVTSEEPQAFSKARQRLIGMRGSYDRVPILGKLSRIIAKQKVEEQTPEANQLTQQRVESGAKQRVESEVNQLVNQFRRGVQQHVLSRLISMDLEPEITQLSTTRQRIIGRYRVAGRDQMAASQPRPTDFESDLLTVQLHQSAINNLIERFSLNGHEFNPVSLGKHVEKVTGIPYESQNGSSDATFKFAKHDAVRIDFEDGVVSITFGFREFRIGKGRPWKDISITTHYKPKYIGTRIILDRDNDNVTEITGKNRKKLPRKYLSITDEMTIRGAFKVVLEEQYAFDLLPDVVRTRVPGLALSIDRLSLAEGWCGVAFENASATGQSVPIVTPEQVVPGSWSDQLGAFQNRTQPQPARTARRLGY